MRYQVYKLSRDRCKIILIPESPAETDLLTSSNDAEIERHYQRAVKTKFGYNAHFIGVTETESPGSITAIYVKEAKF